MKKLTFAFLIVLLFVTATTHTAFAGSNGQQLKINACGSQLLKIYGTNQDGLLVEKTFTSNASVCEQKISGWWWKGSVTVTAYYQGTNPISITIDVPTTQSSSDWYDIGIPNPYVLRAQAWVNKNVSYNQGSTAYPDGTKATNITGYRTDCSGFVSMVWELAPKGLNVPNTVALSNYAITLSSKDDLLPGDTINNRQAGNKGHVIMFVEWVDKNAGKFVAYEELGCCGTVQTNRTLVKIDNGWTITEISSAHNPWYLERKK